VRLFFNSIGNMIQTHRNSVYDNVGQAITTGTEVELRYKPAEFLQLLSGYRYLYSRDLDYHRPLDYRTPHRVLLNARVLTSIGLIGSVEWTYSSGQKGYYVDPGNADVWKKERLPVYALVNAHVRYELGLGDIYHVYFFADAFNLLDQNYYVGSFEPRPGRELLTGIGGRI
jgi:outer membrane receptor protein involved in Fe transport